MAIWFQEGLPGSGKSYETVLRYILPAIKKGRLVQAHVDGLNHEKIAEYLKMDVFRVKALLVYLTKEDLKRLPEVAQDNALIVIDEIQDYWGKSIHMSEAETSFVTQHRHRGLDIVAMGQSVKDVHVIWRRRIQKKDVFINLEGIGKPDAYSVTTYQHKGDDVYLKVNTEIHKYDKAVFGMYKSVNGDHVNAIRTTDGRGNVFNSQLFRYTIPLMLGFAIWGGYSIYGFFSGDTLGVSQEMKPLPAAGQQQATAPAPALAPPPPPPPAPPPPPQAMTQDGAQRALLQDLSDKNRVRLAGLIAMRGKVDGVVEWVDGGEKIVHRMRFADLRELGVKVQPGQHSVTLTHGEWIAIATVWPLTDAPPGKMSQTTVDEVNSAQRPASPAL